MEGMSGNLNYEALKKKRRTIHWIYWGAVLVFSLVFIAYFHWGFKQSILYIAMAFFMGILAWNERRERRIGAEEKWTLEHCKE